MDNRGGGGGLKRFHCTYSSNAVCMYLCNALLLLSKQYVCIKHIRGISGLAFTYERTYVNTVKPLYKGHIGTI